VFLSVREQRNTYWSCGAVGVPFFHRSTSRSCRSRARLGARGRREEDPSVSPAGHCDHRKICSFSLPIPLRQRVLVRSRVSGQPLSIARNSGVVRLRGAVAASVAPGANIGRSLSVPAPQRSVNGCGKLTQPKIIAWYSFSVIPAVCRSHSSSIACTAWLSCFLAVGKFENPVVIHRVSSL